MSSASPNTAAWTRTAERGSPVLMRLMARASLALGRGATRWLLVPITGYFFASAAQARRTSREFLRKCFKREPALGELWRIFFTFSSVIHDRIYFLAGRFELFDVDVRGTDLFDQEGTLLMGAHVGSFEALRACGRHLGQRKVAMAMYEQNAARIARVLGAIDPAAREDIVALGRADSMLELARRLDEGALVGLLADRTLGDEPAVEVEFFGSSARFPTGPMRLAAALRRRVLFMAALHRGGNRYDVRFEPLADFTDLDGVRREERDRRVRDAVAAYAACLEQCVREAPNNWFNFHDFWGRGA